MLTTGQDSQQLINSAQAAARYNNQWSANQAQKQMDFQAATNAKAMKFSADQAKITRDWETEMSNTAHQREVKDLIAAGLNPVLSSKYGGSSTPTAGSAQGVASSGAKGETDNGMTSLFNGMLQALISQATALSTTSMNNQTALQTTKMMNDTAIKTGQMGASAMLGTANINAWSNQYMQSMQQQFEERMKQLYPTSTVGAAASAWQSFIKQFGNSDGSAKYLSDNMKAMENFKSWIQGLIQRDKDLTKELYK